MQESSRVMRWGQGLSKGPNSRVARKSIQPLRDIPLFNDKISEMEPPEVTPVLYTVVARFAPGKFRSDNLQ